MDSVLYACLAGRVQSFLADMSSPLIDCEDIVDLLATEMRELKSRSEDLRMNIEIAKREGRRPSQEVTRWIQSVEQVEDKVSQIEASLFNQTVCLGNCHPDILSRYHLGRRSLKMLTEVAYLKNKVHTFAHIEETPHSVVEQPVGSLMIGMERELCQLQNYFNDEGVSIIGIYGMGGTGKTTLLKKFISEFLQQESYQVLMIKMSNCCSLEDTQKVIEEKLGLHREENQGKEERAYCIYNYLSNRNFVLIFDDLWERINLKELGIPISQGQSNSKIIIVSRKQDVCALMEAKMVKMECLTWENAWRLFVETAGNKELIYSDPKIRRQGKVLVDKCGGLPLALITMGRAMASKKFLQEWEDAVSRVDRKPWKIPGMVENVLSVLNHSCDKLADASVRHCLLYCTLYPEEYAIEKEWIIDHLIGERILDDDDFDHGYELYNYGYHLFGILEAASLLESNEDEDQIKMHPMIRALALWIGTEENKWLVRVNKGLKEVPAVEEWKDVKKISLIENNIIELPLIAECPSLQTLLLQDNSELEKIHHNFFSSTPNLRVLDLSGTSIEELPAGIAMLTRLLYLNVSNTKLRSLPEGLRALASLRCLLLSDTPDLEYIPDGLIGSLQELRVLYMYLSYGDWKVDSTGDGIQFDELCNLRRLKALGITIETLVSLQKLAESPRLATSTRKLHIRSCPDLITLSSEDLGRDHTDLQWLRVSDCMDLEYVVIKGSSDNDYYERSSLPNLQDLNLQHLPKAQISWKGGYLANLSSLSLYCCDGMEELIRCTDEYTVEEEGSAIICPFPNLKRLDLLCLPNFWSLSCGVRELDFPSLEILTVEECPKLKKLPLHAKKLKEIIGRRSWWDEIELDDDTKSKFSQLFKEL